MEASVAERSAQREFVDGMRRAVPVVVAVAPFGMLFGAIAVGHGLSVFEAVLMSAALFAGASQLVGIELFSGQAAVWLVVFSIFAVNFRHILYSAAVGRAIRHFSLAQKAVAFFLLTDPQYAETEQRHESGRRVTFAWYMGLGLPIYAAWVAEAWIGAVFGSLITDPYALGLDLLLPIYFLGLVLGFRGRSKWTPIVAASAAGSILAYWTVGSPWHVSLGALCGVAVAALIGGGNAGDNRSEHEML